MITIISKLKNLNLNEDKVQNVSYQEKCKLLNMNPVHVAWYFQYQVEVFFKDNLVDSPLGKKSVMLFKLNSKLEVVHIYTHFCGF